MVAPARGVGLRHLVILRGRRDETRAGARALIARAPLASVVWISNDADEVGDGALSDRRADAVLGATVTCAVIDGHGGLDPMTLGRVYGVVAGGGALILRLDPGGPVDSPGTSDATRRRLAAWPHPVSAVGDRWFRHLLGVIARTPATDAEQVPIGVDAARPGETTVEIHAEQQTVVEALVQALSGSASRRAVIEAPRGRGKSAALGLALGRALRLRGEPRPVLLASADPDGPDAMLPFLVASAGDQALLAGLRRTTAFALANGDAADQPPPGTVIVIDEAARIPLPVLKRIALGHPYATLLFATTTDGYEGTGQGFVLRFMAWLMADATPCVRLSLVAPIRWAEPDVIEPFVYAALLLDAAPAPTAAFGPAPRAEDAAWRVLDRDLLVNDTPLLREVFGLLRHAHYRTTPRDLEVMLDAPNMHIHVLMLHGHVAAVCLVADEGGLTAAHDDATWRGESRLLAHALADSLVAHMGLRGAGTLRYLRSVRIASHPGLRRLGLASRLVEAVHAHHRPDIFGTLFGATADVIAFRRSLGYTLVRVSASRGARTGEPSVLMLRAATPAGEAIVARARGLFSRDWRLQQQWLFGQDGLTPEVSLVNALNEGTTPVPPHFEDPELLDEVGVYLLGPQTLEQAIVPVACFVLRHVDALPQLPAELAALVRSRLIDRADWATAARVAGMPHAGVAMKAMRRAIAALVEVVTGSAPTPPI